MTKRKVYYVTPGSESGWDVKKENGQKASAHYDTKYQAVNRGKELAKTGGLGQIKIHGQNGKIQTEYTYGKDPFPPKGSLESIP